MIGLLFGSVWPFVALMTISLIAGLWINLRPPKNRDKYRKDGVNWLQ